MTRAELEHQLADLERQIKKVSDNISRNQKNLTRLSNMKEAVTNSLKEAENEPVRVSDHAVVRYIERVWGLNLDNIHKAILPPRYHDAVQGLGIRTLVIMNDEEKFSHRLKIRNGTVVTVLEEDQR